MNDPSQPQLFLNDTSLAISIPRSLQRFSLWLLGSLGAATTGIVLIFAVATQSGADAERLFRGESKGVSGLLSAIVAAHGRPGAL